MYINQQSGHHYRESDPSVIGKNLKLMRCIVGASQKEIADTLHMSRTSYATLENGKRLPDFSTMCALSDFYQVPLGSLLNRDLSYEFFQLLQYDGKPSTDAFLFAYNSLSYPAKQQIAHKITELLRSEQP